MSDNWGTNHHELASPPPKYGNRDHDRDEGNNAPHQAPPSPETSNPSMATAPHPGPQPTTPDRYDDATRPISPDLVAAVLKKTPPPTYTPPPPAEPPAATPPPPRFTQGPAPQGEPPRHSQQGYGHAPQQGGYQGPPPSRHHTGQFPQPQRASTTAHAGTSSLIDRLSPEVLAPPPKPKPSRGWRRAVLWMTGGLINPGLSAAEETHLNQVETIVSRLHGDCYRIGVIVGKGGTGKTTVATLVSSILAEYRSDDRVVVVDADPSFGKLANRVAPSLSQTYWELLNDEDTGQLRRWTDVKASLGSNPHTGLWMLRGEHRSKQRRLITGEVYERAIAILDRYMTVAVIDCGQVLEHPLMDAVLPTLDAVVVVGALEQGGGQAAAQTLEWLEDKGYHRLLNNGVVVLNDPRGRASKRDRKTMYRDFTTHVDAATVLLPYDSHLSEGLVIDTKKGLSDQTRKATIEITAHLARGFSGTTLDGRRR